MTAEPRETITPSESPEPVRLAFRARRVLWLVFGVAFSCEIAMLLLDYHVNYGRLIDIAPIRRLFNTESETAIPSWFAVTQTLLVALTLWAIFITVRARGRRRLVRFGWLMLALLFTYMAADDGAKIHERVGTSFRMLEEQAVTDPAEVADSTLTGRFPSYSWQVVYLPLYAVAGVAIFTFVWWQIRAWTPRLMVACALGCLVLAVGLDFCEGLDDLHPLNLAATIGDTPAVDLWALERFDREGYDVVRHFSKSIEETLEMLGITLLWVVFLRYGMREAEHLELRFISSRRVPTPR